MRSTLATVIVAAIATTAPHHMARAKHHFRHHHECASVRCAHAADRAWARRHRPKFHFRPFELCVANREAGEPGSYSYSTINWHYSGDYEGAYNWVDSTWDSMKRGISTKAHAYEATPREQTLVFRAHANSSDWPNTVPACGG